MQPMHFGIPRPGVSIHAAAQHIDRRGDDKENTMKFLSRFLPRPAARRDLERAYLNGAASLYDLECREREIDRGKFAHLPY